MNPIDDAKGILQKGKHSRAKRRAPVRINAAHKMASVALALALVLSLSPATFAFTQDTQDNAGAPAASEQAISDALEGSGEDRKDAQASEAGSEGLQEGEDLEPGNGPVGDGADASADPSKQSGNASDVAADTGASQPLPQEPEQVQSYTLNLTHIIRYTANGKGRSISISQAVELTQDDFTDGMYAVKGLAYDMDQLEVTEANNVSLDDFDSNGLGGARIVYKVKDGWKIVKKDQAPSNGASVRAVFTGTGIDDYVFVPDNIVRFTLNYVYSNTGALAGVTVTDPATIEAQPVKQDDGTYAVEWALPVKDGFRIVMNADPLNAYLVKPPTGNETPEEAAAALDRGDYNVNVENDAMPVYYSQEHPGITTNPAYNNQYSDQYNHAWNDARVSRVAGDNGYIAEAVCGNNDSGAHASDEDHGANALVDPKIKVILTEAQMNSVMNGTSELGTVTVSYRRNATAYAVNHWVPRALTRLSEAEIQAGIASGEYAERTYEGVDYIRLDRDEIQGRVGALTKAEPITTGLVYEILTPKAYSQEIIKNDTQIDLYYEPISPVRVIFDTNYTYIPRQQVVVGENIDFGHVSSPIRTGYTFGGWQYIEKNAVPDANGQYADSDYISIDGTVSNPSLTVDNNLLSQAKVENVDGMLILHLYPKWVPAQTQVRVVFWTEDLAGGNKDVQATAAGGNPAQYDAKYADYKGEIQSTEPNLGHNNADIYSNVGSFTFNHTTGEALTQEDGSLLPSIQAQIDAEFDNAMIEGTGTNAIHTNVFYTQKAFEVTHGDSGESRATEIAEADGKTTIYVYYTRNVYELMFHYYGHATDFYDTSLTSNYTVATQTDGFSYAPGGASSFVNGSGVLDFSYQNPNYISNPTTYAYARNQWKVTADTENVTNDVNVSATVNQAAVDRMDAANMTVPQTITIRAKYGADLRDVWPVALTSEIQFAADPKYSQPNNGGPANWGRFLRMISWATTAGPYNQAARDNVAAGRSAEPTIMGTYGSMGSEIIADADDPNVTHHLVAYWNDQSVNYYTNNHCFELPGLDIASPGVRTTSIYNGDTTDVQDRLYMVPRNNPAITRYGFTDLMPVSYNSGTIGWDDPSGTYYAVREYNGKFYAVARRVQTLSTAGINNQNPSARLHMTRANTLPDHNTRFNADQSSNANSAYGVASNNINDPYQLYFYYDRDDYDIIYMAPSDLTGTPEYELGRNVLPYGARVTKEMYGFPLNYRDTNDNSAYNWTPTGTGVPVCPDRSTSGTKPWTFIGWALGPSGSNMQWDYLGTRPSGDDFAIQGNLRVYAMWNAPSYTVTFDYAGGTESGSDLGSLSQDISANTRYSASGVVPRPLYTGHTLLGWYVVNADGTLSDTAFDFDAPVTSDMTVRAKWDTEESHYYSYDVYYVSKTLADPSTAAGHETVAIDGEQWYVIGKDEHPDQVYTGRQVDLNISAKPFDGYIPIDTNERLEVTAAGDYDVYVRYTVPSQVTHTVRYVLAGTEASANPTVVFSRPSSADQLVTSPDGLESKKLAHMGYELVSKQADGQYKEVTRGADLTWITPDGDIEAVATLTGANIPSVVTYLVRPLTYTITYTNAPGSPSNAVKSLAAVTAPEGTFVNDSGGKNPTRYITTDSFGIKNPTRVQQDGKWYKFSHWSLGEGTSVGTAAREAGRYDSLSVDPGTVGNLAFVANWVAENPEDPDDPNKPGKPDDPNNPNGPNDPDNPDNPDNPDKPGNSDDPNGGNNNGGGSGDEGDGSDDGGLAPRILPSTGDTTLDAVLNLSLIASVALLVFAAIRYFKKKTA